MSGCPKTDADFERYFFEDLIKRKKGNPADDWKAVMSREYDWNGTLLTIPEGVGPGVTLPPDAPFYGLTQQWRDGDGPVGRLFLPAAEPDNNGFYTRQMQYIARVAPDGSPVVHVWSWDHKDGNDYVPICEGSTPGPGPGPTPPSDCCERLQKEMEILKGIVVDQGRRIEALENNSGFPARIALKNLATGQYVAAEALSSKVLVANRDGIGPWEQFELVVLK